MRDKVRLVQTFSNAVVSIEVRSAFLEKQVFLAPACKLTPLSQPNKKRMLTLVSMLRSLAHC